MLWWMAALALAQDPQGEEGSDPPDDVLIVTANKRVLEAERELQEAILAQGYLPGVSVNGRTLYLPIQPWKPKVVVYEAGFVRVKGRRVTPMALVPVTNGAAGGGIFDGKRKIERMEDRTRAELSPLVRQWQDAIREQSLLERELEVRQLCVATWEGPGSAQERRDTLAELWLNTGEGEAGARIRGVVSTFIDEVVQESSEPYTPSEVRRVNGRHDFEHPFAPEGTES